jgi:hypothetical protein
MTRQMSREEFRKILRRQNWTHAEVAKILGVSERTIRTFARVGVTRPWAIILRAYLAGKINGSDLH